MRKVGASFTTSVSFLILTMLNIMNKYCSIVAVCLSFNNSVWTKLKLIFTQEAAEKIHSNDMRQDRFEQVLLNLCISSLLG